MSNVEIEKITVGEGSRKLKKIGGCPQTRGIGGYNRSKIKTWMKRNRFQHIGWGSTPRMDPCRNSWQCRDSGVIFRIRMSDDGIFVDVGDRDFDRWANSTQETLPFVVFVKKHQQYREIIWSIEVEQELNCMYGVDVEQELTELLIAEINQG